MLAVIGDWRQAPAPDQEHQHDTGVGAVGNGWVTQVRGDLRAAVARRPGPANQVPTRSSRPRSSWPGWRRPAVRWRPTDRVTSVTTWAAWSARRSSASPTTRRMKIRTTAAADPDRPPAASFDGRARLPPRSPAPPAPAAPAESTPTAAASHQSCAALSWSLLSSTIWPVPGGSVTLPLVAPRACSTGSRRSD